MITALTVPLTKNLTQFVHYLKDQQIPHYIIEEDNQQRVIVPDLATAERVKQDYQQNKYLQYTPRSTPKKKYALSQCKTYFFQYLITHLMVCVTLIITGLITIKAHTINWFNFSPLTFHAATNQPITTLTPWENGSVWRLIAPIFMHFSWFHLLGNLALFYYVSIRLEQRHKKVTLLLWLLVLSISSNTSQYLHASHPIFGGLSGVIYGLLALCWMRTYLNYNDYQIPTSIYAFSLIWLILCYTPLISNVANMSHLSGLLTGLLIAYYPSRKKRQVL